MSLAPIRDPVEAVLDLARWAPSGDNEQPWRFERLDEHHVLVRGHDTRDDCVYDLDGSASQIALGALIETMVVAASGYRLRVEARRRSDSPIESPLIDVVFTADASIEVDPLFDSIETRSVQRRPLSPRPLTTAEKSGINASVGDGYRLEWREGWAARFRMASLLFVSAKLRLTMPEAYVVHRNAIEWGARFSEDRVPEAAVGLDPVTARLMRWVMQSWKRVTFFNRFLAGTWAPRLQLDVLPALACAGHFFLVAERAASGPDDFIAAGRAVQRMWLTATHLGLQMQPEVTPLIFARYSRNDIAFSSKAGMSEAAFDIAGRLDQEIGKETAARAVFMGRIGAGPAARSRSLRLPLERLMVESGSQAVDQKLRRNSA